MQATRYRKDELHIKSLVVESNGHAKHFSDDCILWKFTTVLCVFLRPHSTPPQTSPDYIIAHCMQDTAIILFTTGRATIKRLLGNAIVIIIKELNSRNEENLHYVWLMCNWFILFATCTDLCGHTMDALIVLLMMMILWTTTTAIVKGRSFNEDRLVIVEGLPQIWGLHLLILLSGNSRS